MHELDKIRITYLLKYVDRATNREKRKESTAEHIYSMFVLSEYFIKKIKRINREKLHKLILYHDLVEIYAGDTSFVDEKRKKTQENRENKSYKKLYKKLPKELKNDFKKAWIDYSKQKSKEARFCKALDILDPVIQIMQYPKQWKEFKITKKFFISIKEPYLKEFKPLMKFFKEMVKELEKRKLFFEEK